MGGWEGGGGQVHPRPTDQRPGVGDSGDEVAALAAVTPFDHFDRRDPPFDHFDRRDPL